MSIPNQMISYKLLHAWFYHIFGDKHEIYLYGKLSTKLLAQATNKNTKFMYNKMVPFFLSMVSEVTVRNNSKQIPP